MDAAIASQFQRAGADLWHYRVVTLHGGNLSLRLGDRLVVTRHGSMIGHLRAEDLLEATLQARPEAEAGASMDLAVHRAIYLAGDATAVVHAHPSHAIAFSLHGDEITPVDVEGSVLLRQVPVVGTGRVAGPGELAQAVAEALRGRKVIMARGHGCFAAGKDLEEACGYAITLEESCRILWLRQGLGHWGQGGTT